MSGRPAVRPGVWVCAGLWFLLVSPVAAQDQAERKALEWFQAGEFERAKVAFQDILTARPNDPFARYWLGRALLARHESTLARLTFFQLLNVSPASPYTLPARLGIAETFRAERAFAEAVKAYLKVEVDFPDSDSLRGVLLRAGQCLEAAGKPNEAQSVYRRLFDRFPASAEAREAQDRVTALTLASPPGTATATPPPARSQPSGFTLQVGTFKDRSRAEALRARVTQAGLLAEIVIAAGKERKGYRVLAGRFPTADKAKIAAKRLKQEKIITEYRVVRGP
ncbi:MAG: SPOR domain-containing protein [Candidatus Latescibacteria bacterium]|nr:SPOR domain-containing protein [Candidatus Latescibacterota bacterium]